MFRKLTLLCTTLAAAASAAAVLAGPAVADAVSVRPPTNPTVPMGWDNGLYQPCAKEVSPGQPNYFETSGAFCTGARFWTIDVESELVGQYDHSCPGPVNQSFPINTPKSPLSLQLFKRAQGNYTVELKTDLYSTTHPCGSGYFTYFGWLDHANHYGGPLPRPDLLDFSASYWYDDQTPNGQARLVAGMQGFWDGQDHTIDVNLVSTKWGDSNPDPLLLLNDPKRRYIVLDGKALGIPAPKGQNASVDVDWGHIVKLLVSRGYLKAPAGGWSSTTAMTQAVYLGTEVRNLAPSRSVAANLYFTDWRTAQEVGG